MHPHSLQAKLFAVVNAWVRWTFWPAVLARELLLIPQRFSRDEPNSEAATAFDVRTAKQLGTGSLAAHVQRGIDMFFTPSGVVPLRRLQHSYRRSWLLLWESVAFYIAIGVMEFFGIDRLLAAFKPEITWLASVLSGNLDRMGRSRAPVPLSLINVTDSTFSLPYSAAAFPFNNTIEATSAGIEVTADNLMLLNGSGDATPDAAAESDSESCSAPRQSLFASNTAKRNTSRMDNDKHVTGCGEHCTCGSSSSSSSSFDSITGSLSLQDAHLLSMVSKLIYEQPRRIRSVLKRWGIQFGGFRDVPAHLSTTAGYVPDVCWLVVRTPRATIVAFRGADPCFQVSRRADVPTAKTEREGFGGVLDGFYRALFHESHGSTARTAAAVAAGSLSVSMPLGDIPLHTEYQVLEERLQGLMTARQPLYITGHSIGGALASIFAQGLHARQSRLAEHVAGVCTFGAPRFGDAKFAALYDKRFNGRSMRFVYGCDMVPELPTAHLGYVHTHGLRHIASGPLCPPHHRIIRGDDDPAALSAAVAAEDRWAFALSLLKAATAPWREGLVRCFLLPLPGIADHFPCLYERALRAAL